MGSPFEILGIDADAEEREIVDAYRRRVLEAHPDHGGSVREFQAVKGAYERIKAGYDGESVDGDREGRETDREGREPDRESDEAEPEGAHVEYLDYDVLADYGWDLDDDDLFERAATAGLSPPEYGEFRVGPNESLLEAAEDNGFAWPYACRGGACANCAVAVIEGELSTPVDHILPPEMIERGIRLSCVGAPITDDAKVVYNVKHLPDLDELRLPPHPFGQAHQ